MLYFIRYALRMPNAWNFAFEYAQLLRIAPLLQLVGFLGLYMHMMEQRDAKLGPDPKAKQA